MEYFSNPLTENLILVTELFQQVPTQSTQQQQSQQSASVQQQQTQQIQQQTQALAQQQQQQAAVSVATAQSSAGVITGAPTQAQPTAPSTAAPSVGAGGVQAPPQQQFVRPVDFPSSQAQQQSQLQQTATRQALLKKAL